MYTYIYVCEKNPLNSASSNYMNKICMSTFLPENICFRKQSCLQAVGGASMGNAYMYLYIYIYICKAGCIYRERHRERCRYILQARVSWIPSMSSSTDVLIFWEPPTALDKNITLMYMEHPSYIFYIALL